MRRLLISVTSVTFLIVVCCVLIGLFWDGYFLPSKPCRPLTYPDATRTTKAFSIITSDSVDTVLEFYNQHLGVKPVFVSDKGEWRREQLNNGAYLFSCYAGDINRITTESGCIYVSIDGINTKIAGELNRSEGSNVPCMR